MTRALVVLSLLSVLALPTASAAAPGDDRLLAFHAGSVDPVADLVEVTPEAGALVLVQLEARGLDGVVDTVAGLAPVVQPLAPVSLLVLADGAATRRIRELDGVRFAGVLPANLRVAPSVDADTTRLRVTTVVDGRRVAEHLAGDAALARVLATRPDVYSIAEASGPGELRDEKTAQIVATGMAEPQPGYNPATTWGVDGSGVTVAIVDSGVDATHTELDHAVVGCTDYRPTGSTCETPLSVSNDPGGHGTHVAGIVAGDGSSDEGDADGFRYGQGIAPGANLWVQNAIGLGSSRPGMIDLYADSAAQGAVVAQNSWGPAGSPQGYDEDTRETDIVVRDAAPDAAGHQPLALVFSIMNGSGGTSTQGSPDEAKNIIGVGATGADRGRGGDDLCTCSAHGPALDGRLLPDLVAPGQQVQSTASSHGTSCRTPTDLPPGHGSCTGTSMASPHVSGAYALFTERWRTDHGGATPSPALAKAALINTATDLSRFEGVDADDQPLEPVPNNQQGWGRLDVGALMRALDTGVVALDQDVVLDTSGAAHQLNLEPVDPTQPVRVSLVWTDAPGHGMGGELPALVNDLDLRVSDGTTIWLGNAFADGWSVAGGASDTLNNVENVYLPHTSGPLAVTVTAANLIGDGVPGSGDATDQDFALFISNARLAG
jgi:subtilisin family serine protease